VLVSQFTVETLLMKFVPLTVRVVAAAPGAAAFGLSEVMVGGLTVKAAGVEATLPFFTVMSNVPATSSSVADVSVTASAAPFVAVPAVYLAESGVLSLPNVTVEVEMKFVPVIVKPFMSALPAMAEVALIDVIAGAPTFTTNAGDVANTGELVLPLLGFSTVRLSAPLALRSAVGTVTVIAVAVPALGVNRVGVEFVLVTT
jgi:hypothetical protein